MKIVCVDNFNRDHIGDTLVCENVSLNYALVIVDILNEKFGGEHSSDHFVIKSESYELYDPHGSMF